MGLREDILKTPDLASADVTVAKWGGRTVRLVELTAAQRMAYQEATERFAKERPGPTAYLDGLVLLVAWSAFDPETGERLFRDEDVEELKKRSLSVVRDLGMRALTLGKGTEAPETTQGNS